MRIACTEPCHSDFDECQHEEGVETIDHIEEENFVNQGIFELCDTLVIFVIVQSLGH
jgi:hypothetical protein